MLQPHFYDQIPIPVADKETDQSVERGVPFGYCCGPRVATEVSLGISCRMAGPGVSRCSGTKFKTLDLNQLALGMRHEFLPIF